MKILKKVLKVAGILVGVGIILCAAFLIHTWYFKPLSINLFFARTALQVALESPEMLSSLRVLEPMGIDYHNDDLDDDSVAAGDRLFEYVREAHATLLSYQDLNTEDQLSKDIALSLMSVAVRGEKFRFHNYPLNQMFGVQNGFPSFMDSTHQVTSTGTAEDYVARLSKVDTKFEQVMEGLRLREERGIIPPQFVVEKVLEEMTAFVEAPPEENILYASFVKKMDEAEFEEADKARFAALVKTEIIETVHPAYGLFIDYFRSLQHKTEGNFGVWKLPDGDEYYQLALSFFTTSDYTPDEIHKIGVQDVARIQAQILDILTAEGYTSDGDFAAAILAMKSDPRFYYPDSDAGRAQILADYGTIIDEAEALLDNTFDVQTTAAVEVKRVPEFKQKTAPGAYYNAPAMDGSRPGTFYANLYDIEATPKYGMRTLAYHEAVPGHHFQTAVQRELEGLPFFRRLIPFTAYSEGWALYAERLAWEMGLLENPFDNIGRLQAELFRAVRLVVDTGIHSQRWSRERAIDYMVQNTGIVESEVITEIERYFVLPGQACAYKVGMIKILELRAFAQRELGEAFDLKKFHNVVLTNGEVPLTILEQLVREYVNEALSR